MAGIVETQTAAAPFEASSKSRSRMEIHRLNFDLSDSAMARPPLRKRQRKDDAAVQSSDLEVKRSKTECPRYGVTSVCGRRRDMEDSVAIHPSFCGGDDDGDVRGDLHFFGVFDGHGCSHVSRRCKERMHEIVRDEYEKEDGGGDAPWEDAMVRSFRKMDDDVAEWSSGLASTSDYSNCRCEMRTPQRDSVGSTAVVAVISPDKIVVSNCGDSCAVLCRNGVAIPLSVDHKPDRPDELRRIEEAGGRVIYWDGPRVLGVLAMSRAIGDSYLKAVRDTGTGGDGYGSDGGGRVPDPGQRRAVGRRLGPDRLWCGADVPTVSERRELESGLLRCIDFAYEAGSCAPLHR
ncbi:hypothetical protein SASPL_156358 [Salvia splendens]|uniref:protein-serine/threonine phosphatase n=1 Tax=Salvia splendens TaxID=180675 RepID=A0A8X8VWS8_SALSN|nr:hypothetical protein SASPL_156358 [Salvia splendens]